MDDESAHVYYIGIEINDPRKRNVYKKCTLYTSIAILYIIIMVFCFHETCVFIAHRRMRRRMRHIYHYIVYFCFYFSIILTKVSLFFTVAIWKNITKTRIVASSRYLNATRVKYIYILQELLYYANPQKSHLINTRARKTGTCGDDGKFRKPEFQCSFFPGRRVASIPEIIIR